MSKYTIVFEEVRIYQTTVVALSEEEAEEALSAGNHGKLISLPIRDPSQRIRITSVTQEEEE